MYQVLYTPLQTFGEAIGAGNMNVTGLRANLTDLEEYVEYNISVRAYTSVGAGPYSNEQTIQTLEDGKFNDDGNRLCLALLPSTQLPLVLHRM